MTAWTQPEELATGLSARARSEIDRYAAVDKVIVAMHERINCSFALEEMAQIAFLSRFYFNRVFRELTGLPPVRFHMALRIAAAKRLLLTTDMTVTDVCLELGYQSLGTFTTQFHELVGVSPGELRRTMADPDGFVEAFASRLFGGGWPAVEGQLLGADREQVVYI